MTAAAATRPRRWREAIEVALEALEVGDVYGAEQTLLAALERRWQPPRRWRCPVCGIAFEWPGQLDDHLALVHPDADVQVAA